jgi:C-5 cytosine-specific DNA methylase
MKPLAIDLFCGLGGWSEGLLAEGFDVVGFDIERHQYGEHRYPATLVIQDALTLHGAQFRDAALIVASPPCQRYSWMAMPWSKAKAAAHAIREDETGTALAELNELFDACFRIQAQASLAAGRHIPMVVENVRGAQPWVGRARWSLGSFYLWGDVPALMPITTGRKNSGGSWFAVANNKGSGLNNNPVLILAGRQAMEGIKGVPHRTAGHWTNPAEGLKGSGGSWMNGPYRSDQHGRNTTSGSSARKAASAMIAKIPLPLSRHIAKVYRP